MDTKLLLMTGTDYPVPECGLVIHQPTIEEIGLIGEDMFFIGVQSLTITKNTLAVDKSVLDETTNFQIFMMIMKEKDTLDKRQAVQDLLTILLPNYKTIFTPQSLLLNKTDKSIVIDDSNFEFLQQAILEIFCMKNLLSSNTTFNPKDAEAKRIADKIMAGRKKIAKEKGEGVGSVYGQYLSILSIGLHLSILELKKYTVYQVYDAIERFGLYIDFDLDIRSRLAGGSPDRSPENWMKNIH